MAIITKTKRSAQAAPKARLTQTQKNGQRTRKAVKNWSELLECTAGFAPIRNKNVRNNTAMLLENQMRWLNENSPAMTTAMFGPQNGLHGGELGNSDFYAPGDMRNPTTILPMVRRIYPALMSNETVGVQPMPGPVALAFAIRYRYLKGANALGDSSTEHVHGRYETLTAGEDGAVTRAGGSSNRDGAGWGVEGGEYTASGIRGVETKAMLKVDTTSTTDTSAKLITVVGNGFPQSFDVVSEAVKVTIDTATEKHVEKEVRFLHPVLVQIAGAPIDTTSKALKTGFVYVNGQYGYNVTDGTAQTPAAVVAAAYGQSNVTTSTTYALVAGKKIVGISTQDTAKAQISEIKFNAETGKWDLGNSEMGYQRLDTRFTGAQDKQLLQPLAGGRWKFRLEDTGIAARVHAFEATGAIARTSFGFEKQAVEAGTRRLSTSWTLETQEDLKNTNGIDIDTEATQQMSYELQAEIDREMTVRMLFTALKNNEWSVWSGKLADARWMGERARAFYQFIIKMAMRMRVRNRRGAANFIVCTPDVAALLQMLEDYVPMQVNNTIELNNAQSAAAGTLGGNKFNVYIDERTAVYSTADYGMGYESMFDHNQTEAEVSLPNYCMLGYKGADTYDAGIIYCPYIPIMVQTATDTNSFSPHVGLMTRYGVMDNIFGSHLYYHVILIDDFSNPGVHQNDNSTAPKGQVSMYPNGYAVTGTSSTDMPSYAFPTTATWTGDINVPAEAIKVDATCTHQA